MCGSSRATRDAYMASLAYGIRSSRSRPTLSAVAQPLAGSKRLTEARRTLPPSDTVRQSKGTVFDLLYDSYLPFRLYADYMLGSSPAELAKQFALPENWVIERIESVRLCGKQVRLNLLDSAAT